MVTTPKEFPMFKVNTVSIDSDAPKFSSSKPYNTRQEAIAAAKELVFEYVDINYCMEDDPESFKDYKKNIENKIENMGYYEEFDKWASFDAPFVVFLSEEK